MLCEPCHEGTLRAVRAGQKSNELTDYTSSWELSLSQVRAGDEVECLNCCSIWNQISYKLSDSAKLAVQSRAEDTATRKVKVEIKPGGYFDQSLIATQISFHVNSRVPSELFDVISLNVEEERIGFYELFDIFWAFFPSRRSDSCLQSESLAKKHGPRSAFIDQISRWLSWDRAKELGMGVGPILTRAEYPSRLVCLTEIKQRAFSVVSTASWVAHEDYAALSYPWAGTTVFRCLNCNLQRLMNGLSIDGLDRNIVQVMEMVVKLGIQYIWIDALCIVQDNDADWKREAERMSGVYNGATLTVAMNIKEGDELPLLDTALSHLGRSLLSGSTKSEPPMTTTRHHPSDVMAVGSLAHRGWCLQERLLAKRILHIFRHDVFWEGCPQHGDYIRTLEEPDMEIPLNDFHGFAVASRASLASIGRRPCGANRAMYDQNFLKSWFRVLMDYSGRKLSFMRDRLPAIDAVAQLMSSASGLEYRCGVWLELLPFCLSWSIGRGWRMESAEPEQRTKLPSWSWAKRMGYVSTGFPDANIWTQVPQKHDEVFALATATFRSDIEHILDLTIYGRLFGPIQARPFLGFGLTDKLNPRQHDCSLKVHDSLLSMAQELGFIPDPALSYGLVDFDDLDYEADPPADDIWYFPLITAEGMGRTGVAKISMTVMLMKKSPERDVFERVGLLTTEFPGYGGSLAKPPKLGNPTNFTLA